MDTTGNSANPSFGTLACVAVGAVLAGGSFVASLLLVPWLIPILQVALLVAAIPGLVCGVAGAYARRRWVALAAIGAVTLLWVLLNLRGPAGFLAMLELYWFGRQPPGLRYYDTWMHAFHTFAIPLNLGVALVAYEATLEWRQAALRAWRTSFMKCAECGYNLTGNLSGRCPECGAEVPSNKVPPANGHAR